MIYELRTYILKPGSVRTFEERFAEALPARTKYSPLGGLWHTEIGPLNQVVHIWPYEDLAHYQTVRAKWSADPSGKWPPKVGELQLEMQSEFMVPAPFMRPLTGEPQKLGNVYEMRTYTYQPGAIPKVIDIWAKAIAQRETHSPLAACLYSQIGGLNRYVHIWPYQDLNERARLRAKSFEDPYWPPTTQQWLIRQENKILLPAACSPLH